MSGKGQGPPQGKGPGHLLGIGRGPPQGKGDGPPQDKDQGLCGARTFGETLSHMDYNIDTNPREGFTTRGADRETYVQKASLVHTVHECVAARKWAWEQGAKRYLWFEKDRWQKDKNGNLVIIHEWVAEIEVWGNYDLTEGDFFHGWDMDRSDLDLHAAQAPDFIGKVYGDGACGNMATIVYSNRSRILLEHKYWCCVLPDEAAFWSLRAEIQTGKAWNPLLNATWQELGGAAGLPAEDRQVFRHLVAHHNLNHALPSVGCAAMSG